MNTRSKVLLLSGDILEYFSSNKAPKWEVMFAVFARNNITKLTGMENLSKDFLEILFQNSEHILQKIEFFKQHHHYLIILLMKDEYSLETCSHCGHLTRKIGIDVEDFQNNTLNDWNY